MPAIMPRGLQVFKIREELERRDVDPDLVDVEALVDPELHYSENVDNVFRQVMGGRGGLLAFDKLSKRAAAAHVEAYLESSSEGRAAAGRRRPGCPPGGRIVVREHERGCPRERVVVL